MCSFFQNKETGESIFTKLKKVSGGNFEIEVSDNLTQKKIAPTNKVITITTKAPNEYKIGEMTWGIQFGGEKKSHPIYNSRIETIKEKPYWQNLFNKNRCLLPATGFYEWTVIENTKIPHLISMKEGLFFMPSIFVNIDGGLRASIITVPPNEFMLDVHNRMPVLIRLEHCLDYICSKPEEAIKYCEPYANGEDMSIEIAEELLTVKQREVLGR